MQKQRTEKENAPEVTATGASSVQTQPFKEGFNMGNVTNKSAAAQSRVCPDQSPKASGDLFAASKTTRQSEGRRRSSKAMDINSSSASNTMLMDTCSSLSTKTIAGCSSDQMEAGSNVLSQTKTVKGTKKTSKSLVGRSFSIPTSAILDKSASTSNRAVATVDFHGAHITVLTTEVGQRFVAMRPICDAIGLQWEAQLKRIKRNAVLNEGMSIMDTPSGGGVQKTVFLLLDYLNGWLFGIEVNRTKPEIRERLKEYQRECFHALHAYWNDGIAINPRAPYAVHPGQTLSAEQADTLRMLLTENVKKLPKAKQGGAMVKGWSKLKSHFKTDYRHIPAGEFHEAVNILARHVAEWELVDEAPKLENRPTVQETVAGLVKKIEEPNGYPAFLFQPLVDAVLRKSGRRLVQMAPDQMLVDCKKLAAVWVDLGKLRNRIDGLGMLESDLPPSWWESNAISAA